MALFLKILNLLGLIMHVTVELNEYYTQSLLKLQKQSNRPLPEIVTQLVEHALEENSISNEIEQSIENESPSTDDTHTPQANISLRPSVLAAFDDSLDEFDSLYRELAK